jgi:hypothetical protein
MRHARRFIAILVGCATWCLAASSVAYAKVVDDPGPAGIPVVTSPGSSGRPLWQILAFVALGVLLAVAIVGLVYSLSHSRRSEHSPRSQTPLRF